MGTPENKVVAVVASPGKSLQLGLVGVALADLQALVGGFIEQQLVCAEPGLIVAVFNEEGKRLRLRPSVAGLVGTVVFLRLSPTEATYADLRPEDLVALVSKLGLPVVGLS